MRNYPLVSIVTPSYNQGKFIRETIESVINQDYPNIEHIVIDGGSTDNTVEIIKEYGDKIKWISEKDEGQSDAINKGFKLAKGEIIAWLNSDDTYAPDCIKTAVEYFQNHTDIALIYGEGDIIDENSNRVCRFGATQPFDLWALIHVWDYIMQPTTFFKKEAIEEVGYLDKKLNWAMDWDLWIRLACRYNVGYIPKVLANSREYGDTKTSTGGIKRFKELVKLMRKYGNRKYPPGYFLYGSSTMNVLTQDIPIINFFTKGFMWLTHKAIFTNLPVVYKDGWIGRKAYVILPNSKNNIVIKGEAIFEQLLPLHIRIFKDNQLIASNCIKNKGYFEIRINDISKVREMEVIEIYSDRWIVPNKIGISQDKRRLSFLLKEIFYI